MNLVAAANLDIFVNATVYANVAVATNVAIALVAVAVIAAFAAGEGELEALRVSLDLQAAIANEGMVILERRGRSFDSPISADSVVAVAVGATGGTGGGSALGY